MTIAYSKEFNTSIIDIIKWGIETFGGIAAERYEERIYGIVDSLRTDYLMYPECRWIPTRGRIYRNIILDSYLIIYRITDTRIEVLQIISSHRSISKIRGARNIRISE